MAEADTKQLYPQATPLGTPIPFEIVRPLGLIVQGFTDVAVSNVAIPTTADFLILRATTPCYVQFTENVAAVDPANGTHTVGLVYVDAEEVLVIDHNAAPEFSVIRATAENGDLIVQTCTKYADIRKAAQTERM